MRLVLSSLLVFGVCYAGSCQERDDVPAKPVLPTMTVTELLCEHLEDPLAIDVKQPRLSWKLRTVDAETRGQRQTAFRIIVSDTMEGLLQSNGNLWDSGVVESDQSVLVTYRGKPLQSGMVCYWKVRVEDQAGNVSPWSAPASWRVGRLEPSDWTAEWIGTDQVFERKKGWPPPDNTIPDPWFRKTFRLDRTPKEAVITVASVGYHELYVNGKKVEDYVLMPCATDHKLRARYVTYDITKHLKAGNNVIAFWLGLSWSIFPHYKTDDKPQSPIVRAQADIRLPGARKVSIVTDKTWKTHPSPNTLLGVWDFMHYGGEFYDANMEIAGWCDADFDDSGWKDVTVFNPNLTMSAQKVEPNRPIELMKPADIQVVSNGIYRIDMGRNYAGWFEMDLQGKPGTRIDFQYSERPDQPMTHRHYSAFIIGPEGQGTFRNHFNYSSARWVTVKGLENKPDEADIRGWMINTDYKRTGKFECNIPLLNRIYDTTLWTFQNLSLGGYLVDCPQRERMGYGGDAHATILTGLSNYRLGAFYNKWVEDWRDVQKEDGNLPYTAPTYWGGGGPGWSGFCITLPWEVYRYNGDTRILEENFPMMQRWLSFLETQSKDDMLVRWGGEWDFLGDWLWPAAKGVNGDTTETLFFNNCYWIYNLETAARIAGTIGDTESAGKYSERAKEVSAAVHEKFFDSEHKTYVNSFQAYLATALLVGLPPESLKVAVWKSLEKEILETRKGHIHAGITGGAFLFKTLMEYDRQDLLYTMVSKEDYPGWGDMLNKGATTIWEDWEGRQSLLHSSYLYVGAWFINGLGGIKPDPESAGFKKFIIKPGICGQPELKNVTASYESPYGLIESSWKIDGTKFVHKITVPANSSATYYMPCVDSASIMESGKPLAEAAGISIVRKEKKQAVLSLEPGHYKFESQLSK